MIGPAISVVMTVWNEPEQRVAGAIAAAIESAPPDMVEVLLAGDSSDASLAGVAGRWPGRVTIVNNPGGRRSPGLNRAIAASSAPIVCRVDARSRVSKDYLERCAARLADPMVGAVGGHQVPIAPGRGAIARGIARALRNPWLLGAPAYRRPNRSGPVDTVYLGAWRRDDLVAIGGFDESLDANEDFDVFARVRAAGKQVWLEEGLEVGYLARADLVTLFRQYFAFGRWKVEFWRRTGSRPNARQAAAMGVALVAAAILPSVARCPRRALLAGVGTVGAMAVIDHIADPRGPADERPVAVVASGVVLAAWITGLGRGLLSGRSWTAAG